MLLFRPSAIFLLLLSAGSMQAAPLKLSIVPGAQTVLTGSTSARYEFGTRRVSDDSPLTHTFFLRNSANTVLTIERVEASCDCIQAEIAETPSLPVKLLPGQTVPVLVSVTMRRLLPGAVSKSIWIYRHGSNSPAVHLEMHGTVQDDSSLQTRKNR